MTIVAVGSSDQSLVRFGLEEMQIETKSVSCPNISQPNTVDVGADVTSKSLSCPQDLITDRLVNIDALRRDSVCKKHALHICAVIRQPDPPRHSENLKYFQWHCQHLLPVVTGGVTAWIFHLVYVRDELENKFNGESSAALLSRSKDELL